MRGAGAVPTEIGLLFQLSKLDLSDNELNGVPKIIVLSGGVRVFYKDLLAARSNWRPRVCWKLAWVQLTKLDLHENDLTGACPENSPVCSWYVPQSQKDVLVAQAISRRSSGAARP